MVVGLMPYFLSPIGTSCHLRPKEEVKPDVILNDSEESHRRTDGHKLYRLSRGIFRLRSI